MPFKKSFQEKTDALNAEIKKTLQSTASKHGNVLPTYSDSEKIFLLQDLPDELRLSLPAGELIGFGEELLYNDKGTTYHYVALPLDELAQIADLAVQI